MLWGLNHSLGCSPLGVQAYPEPPSPRFYDSALFGVGQRTEGFLPHNSLSVSLPKQKSPPGLDYGQLRLEPAISELDWLFTPRPRSEERLSTEPLRASISYYGDFTLPRPRSLGFRSCPSDFQHFHTVSLTRRLRTIAFAAGASC